MNGFIGLGATGVYTATVHNTTDPAVGGSLFVTEGKLTSTLPTQLGGQTLVSDISLQPTGTIASTASFTAATNAGSGKVLVNSALAAQLYDPAPSYVYRGNYSLSSSLQVTIDADRPTADTATTAVRSSAINIIGGTASDPTSYISRVQVSIDGGAFTDADISDCRQSGNAPCAWAFAWDVPAGSATYAVAVKATDAVGNEQVQATVSNVGIDDLAPSVTSGVAGNPIVAAGKNADDQWTLPLSGSASDPGSGSTSSGLDRVEVMVEPNGSGWQPAQLIASTGASTWQIDYPLSAFDSTNDPLLDPTGSYTFTVRAVDKASNVTAATNYAIGTVRIDTSAPAIRLTGSNLPGFDISATRLITSPMTLSGVVTETGSVTTGIASAEMSLTWDKVTDVYANTVLAMPFDDPPGATTFRDVSRNAWGASCDLAAQQCPDAGAAGRFGKAIRLTSTEQVVIAPTVPISTTGYALVGWFNAGQDGGIFAVNNASATDRQIYLSGGNVCADVLGSSRETICSVNVNYADGGWHMVAQTLGGGGQLLYVDGRLAASGSATSSSLSGAANLIFGRAPQATTNSLRGSLDEFKLFDVELSAESVLGFYQSWQPASLASAGSSVNATTWSAVVPFGLEGYYSIDLTASDAQGNRNDDRFEWSQWRGEIDTAPPSLEILIEPGASFGGTRITGIAEDLNLDRASLQLPCFGPNGEVNDINPNYLVGGQMSYNTLTRPGAPLRLNKVVRSCTIPGYPTGTFTIRACDTYGHCAAKTSPQYQAYIASSSGIVRASASDGAGQQLILDPTKANPTGGIAIDSQRQQMYWVEATTIRRANLDGTGIETIISGLSAPRRIAVAEAAGKVYWSEPGAIKRANLDGSGVEILVAGTGIASLSLDVARSKIFWAAGKTISSANLDGSGQSTFASLETVTDGFQGAGSTNFLHPFRDVAVNPVSGRPYFSLYATCVSPTQVYILEGCQFLYNGPSLSTGYAFRVPPTPGAANLRMASSSTFTPQVRIEVGSESAVSYDTVAFAPDGTLFYAKREGGLYRGCTYLSAGTATSSDGGICYAGEPTIFGGNVRGVAFTLVKPPVVTNPDLRISKTASAPTIVAGGTLTYTLAVRNVGAVTGGGVIVTDTLPTSVTFLSASTTRGESCPAPSGALFQCSLAPIDSGAGVDVFIRVQGTVSAVGPIQNNASVGGSQADSDTTNNNAINVVSGITPTPTDTPTNTPTATNTPTNTPTPTRGIATPTPSGAFTEKDPRGSRRALALAEETRARRKDDSHLA
ncbi:DUF11 domain-containing protein [Chloroflexales bacterium ZM16-3]|nr:DUF11 domain-containing protein [Chloroflexales bacterium ZM16-3]